MSSTLTSASCFVHGMILNGDGSGTEITEGVEFEGKPVWIHVDYSESDCASTLQALGVADNVVESIVRTNTRPRTLAEKGGFLIFLRAVNLNPGDTPDDMVSLRVWLEPNRLITVRQRKVFSIQDIRTELREGRSTANNIQELFVQIIERLADRISEYVDGIEEKVALHEEQVDAGISSQVRAQVSSLRRQVAQVRRYLAPQRDALDSFYRQSRDVLSETLVYDLHEQTDRIVRYVEDLDLVRERCLVLQEELMNLIAQEQNDRMYVLSIVAAIFLPISFVTGLFGMNVAGLPGIEEPLAFTFVAGSMAAIVAGIVAYFRLKKWV